MKSNGNPWSPSSTARQPAPPAPAAAHNPEDNPAAVQSQRVFGVLGIVLGLGLTWFQVWQPLASARAHAQASMHISMKLAALAPLALFLGVLFVVAPRFSLVHLGQNRSTPRTPLGWAILLFAIGLGFALWFWMEAQFRALGYSTSF